MRCSWSIASLLLLLVLGLHVSDANATANLPVNGWYPCAYSDFMNSSAPVRYECAEVQVPLCHDQVCQSDKTISVFVKRLPANVTTDTPTAMWVLQGGPGASSSALETSMEAIYDQLQGASSIYTMDHRGTGRSFFLKCDAAQALTLGSPGGSEIGLDELPNCAKDVLFQIDNHTEAFSVTSAAKDIVLLSSALIGDNVETYLYGCSYGTYWAQRVMHIAPAQFKAYVFDGSFTEKSASFEHFGSLRMEPEQNLAQLCQEDKVCSTKYGAGDQGNSSLQSIWLKTYAALDAAKPGENACADLIRGGNQSITYTLRAAFSSWVDDLQLRMMLPAMMAMLKRCNTEDVTTLTGVFAQKYGAAQGVTLGDAIFADSPPQPLDPVAGTSNMLMFLIKASELWSYPSPAYQDEASKVLEGVFTNTMELEYAWVCLLRGDLKDPSCAALEDAAKTVAKGTDVTKIVPVPFVYKPDAYFQKTAKIPDFASALVINGNLDFHTVPSLGVGQYEDMQGAKMYVEFTTGTHCAGISQQTADDATQCGYKIIASFVKARGDLTKVNTECIADLPSANFDVDEDIQMLATGGAMPAPSSGSGSNATDNLDGIVGKRRKQLLKRLRIDKYAH